DRSSHDVGGVLDQARNRERTAARRLSALRFGEPEGGCAQRVELLVEIVKQTGDLVVLGRSVHGASASSGTHPSRSLSAGIGATAKANAGAMHPRSEPTTHPSAKPRALRAGRRPTTRSPHPSRPALWRRDLPSCRS